MAPQAVVGDFDSLEGQIAEALQAAGVELLRHPAHKDVTDGELAIEEALRRGAAEVLITGATGALDHTLGHLAILHRLQARGIAARLVAPDLAVTVLIAPVDVTLAAPVGVRVSLAPVGADAIVSLSGLEYPLDHGRLPADACVGLGNHVLVPGAARIVIHAGSVVALVEWDGESFRGAVGEPTG
jgi:thiamine pyrophosphokinase